MSALTLPGCLITQPVQFEPPSGSPPAITGATTHESHPLDEIILVQVDQLMAGDGGGSGLTPIVVEVRDPDVDQELAYKVYVDYNPSDPRPANPSGFIPTIGRIAGVDRTRRRLEFAVPTGTGLGTVGCHRIELRVSGGFRPDTPDPVRDGDIATAVWWVATQPVGGGTVDMGSCP